MWQTKWRSVMGLAHLGQISPSISVLLSIQLSFPLPIAPSWLLRFSSHRFLSHPSNLSSLEARPLQHTSSLECISVHSCFSPFTGMHKINLVARSGFKLEAADGQKKYPENIMSRQDLQEKQHDISHHRNIQAYYASKFMILHFICLEAVGNRFALTTPTYAGSHSSTWQIRYQ